MKIKENKNQLSLLQENIHGCYDYHKPVEFHGNDISKKDHTRLENNLKIVFEALLKIGWHTNEELMKATNNFNCDRYRRYVSEGKIDGYSIEKKNLGNGIFKYRIVRVLK